MDFIRRVENKIFKTYLHSSIEYHAGGYFVRKLAQYLIIVKEVAYIYEKEEGLHPNDNNYDLLVKEIINSKSSKLFIVTFFQNNILKLSNKDDEFKLIPSIFIENILTDSLTELLLDTQNSTKIFFFISEITG